MNSEELAKELTQELTQRKSEPMADFPELTQGDKELTQELTQRKSEPMADFQELTQGDKELTQELTQRKSEPMADFQELTQGDKELTQELTQRKSEPMADFQELTQGDKELTQELTQRKSEPMADFPELTQEHKETKKNSDFTIAEISKMFGISRQTVNKRMGYLQIKPIKRLGNTGYYDIEQIAHLEGLDKHCKEYGCFDGYPVPTKSGLWSEEEQTATISAQADRELKVSHQSGLIDGATTLVHNTEEEKQEQEISNDESGLIDGATTSAHNTEEEKQEQEISNDESALIDGAITQVHNTGMHAHSVPLVIEAATTLRVTELEYENIDKQAQFLAATRYIATQNLANHYANTGQFTIPEVVQMVRHSCEQTQAKWDQAHATTDPNYVTQLLINRAKAKAKAVG